MAKGAPPLEQGDQGFLSPALGRLIFLSRGETLDFPGQEFAVRGSIAKQPPPPSTSLLLFSLSCKIPEVGGSKEIASLRWGRDVRPAEPGLGGALCINIKHSRRLRAGALCYEC